MLVMLTDGLSISGRGYVRRWLQEIRPGVFFGHASALVREELWVSLESKYPKAGVIQIWPATTEQRFGLRMRGISDMSVETLDGLTFLSVQDAAWSEAWRRFGHRVDAE